MTLKLGKDYLISESNHTQDFKLFPREEMLRGVAYGDTRRSNVFIGRHECIEEIIQTCTHEEIHLCISDEQEDNDLIIDEEQEHNLIRFMVWAEEFLVENNELDFNSALREEFGLVN